MKLGHYILNTQKSIIFKYKFEYSPHVSMENVIFELIFRSHVYTIFVLYTFLSLCTADTVLYCIGKKQNYREVMNKRYCGLWQVVRPTKCVFDIASIIIVCYIACFYRLQSSQCSFYVWLLYNYIFCKCTKRLSAERRHESSAMPVIVFLLAIE